MSAPQNTDRPDLSRTEVVDLQPSFSEAEARGIARDLFGLEGNLEALPSERDQNFRVRADAGGAVLKISQAGEQRGALELQHAALARVAERSPELEAPRVLPALDGAHILELEGSSGRPHLVRALGWLPGKPLASVRPRSAALGRSLGEYLGKLDRCLEGLEHPDAERELRWDLARGLEVLERYRSALGSGAQAELFDRHRERIEGGAALFGSLRRSIVHQDANDHNVLVSDVPGEQRVVGLIDYGDMLMGWTLAEVAVAAAYAMLDVPDPLSLAAALVAGYHGACPIPEGELLALFDLICLRLCTSVAISAHEERGRPGDSYVSVSAGPAWRLLAELDGISPALVHARLRGACGLEPSPTHDAVVGWLESHCEELESVVEPDPRAGPWAALDLSVASHALAPLPPAPSLEELEAVVERARRDSRAVLALGRYDEARLFYASPQYAARGPDGPVPRSVHLGLDLFLPAGTAVRAPLEGVVSSLRDNADEGDYGPTVILRHAPPGGPEFYTLFGHLARASMEQLEVGQVLEKGEVFAALGEPAENGGWPAHLHLQLVCDLLGSQGDFPGVARADERALWLSLCPDPNLLCRIPEAVFPPVARSEELQAGRRAHLSSALSLSYARPLHIVRGRGQWLHDAGGRSFLDAVNNVPHVGHSHPRVVSAGQGQLALLNTNTRYLHAGVVRYAERLAALLPDPLEVCFFVNSGSEANELALRLARAHTGGCDAVVIEGGYHGNTTTLVEHSAYKFEGPGGFEPPEHVHRVPMPDTYRGAHGSTDPQAGARYAEHVRLAAEEISAAGRRPCAFLAEALIGCGGQVVPPPGYLAAAFEHVRAAGGVCIADEVQVGFGRAGERFWAFELQEVVPDIVTLGKPIANGHPMGAVVTTRAIADSFVTGMEYFNTFGGNPVSCAMASAVLDVIEEEGLQARAQRVGAQLLEGLGRLGERFPLVGEVRGVGMYLGVELVLDRAAKTPAPEHAAHVVERMKERGVLLSTDGPFHNVLKIKPPLAFGEADAVRLVEALGETLAESALSLG